jgi:hypothetical protein
MIWARSSDAVEDAEIAGEASDQLTTLDVAGNRIGQLRHNGAERIWA